MNKNAMWTELCYRAYKSWNIGRGTGTHGRHEYAMLRQDCYLDQWTVVDNRGHTVTIVKPQLCQPTKHMPISYLPTYLPTYVCIPMYW